MSVIMEETGRSPMKYLGQGKKPSARDVRKADLVLKKLEKYFGEPISTK